MKHAEIKYQQNQVSPKTADFKRIFFYNNKFDDGIFSQASSEEW